MGYEDFNVREISKGKGAGELPVVKLAVAGVITLILVIFA